MSNDLLEFAHAVKEDTYPHLDRIHGSGANIIHTWIEHLFIAASEDDGAEMARLIKMIRHKLKLERLLRIESYLTAYRERHPRLRAWLHEELIAIGWRKAGENRYST